MSGSLEERTQYRNGDLRSAVDVGHVDVVVEAGRLVHVDDRAAARCERSGRRRGDYVYACEPKPESLRRGHHLGTEIR